MKYKGEIVIIVLLMLIGASLGHSLNKFVESECFEIDSVTRDYPTFEDYDLDILEEDYKTWKSNNCENLEDKLCRKLWER